METILTVLITLGVCVVLYAFVGVVRLNRKVNDLEEMRMEMVDMDMKMEKFFENLDRDMRETQQNMEKDYIDRINKWVASSDRRFDYLKSDVIKLDEIINPNKDIIG